ncbi:MAG: RidA family protein [Sandaracinaceae bacterium]|nr:RidA family protein [Sandaracinaceae bacterium]
MERRVISTADAPAAIGPYSQAVRAGNLVFLSGQIPLDPKSGEMVGGQDASAQAEQVLDNLRAVLAAAGCAFSDVVKTTIFLTDLGDFAAVNAVYAKRFEGAPPPARATVQVAALPRGAKVEIEMIAALG